ncbi:MAG: hypothetical protein DWQ01_09665 [Planctomycetota bacterium]|nr:MAG: hypothetical protein DWQ01_09665 [Planctomycetota bacterium]
MDHARLSQVRVLDVAREQGCRSDDLRVEAGDTLTLSPDSELFRHHYLRLQPKNIDEVRQYIGLSDAVLEQASTRLKSSCNPKSNPCRLSARLISPEQLEDEDPELRNEALQLTQIAAREYVMGDSNRVLSWKPILDRYVSIAKIQLQIAVLQDITVGTNATLNLSPNTHALYANRIRIHTGGKIRCNGPKTFRCASIEGNLP